MIGSLVLHIIDFRPPPLSAFDKLLIVVSERSKVFVHCTPPVCILLGRRPRIVWLFTAAEILYGWKVSCPFEGLAATSERHHPGENSPPNSIDMTFCQFR